MPEELARRLASLPALAAAPDIVSVADRTGKPVQDVAATYFAAGAFFQLDRIANAARGIQVTDYFDRLALDRALDSIGEAERRLTAEMVGNGVTGPQAVEAWVAPRAGEVRAHPRRGARHRELGAHAVEALGRGEPAGRSGEALTAPAPSRTMTVRRPAAAPSPAGCCSTGRRSRIFTLITTFVYAPYFASAIAPDPVRGQALWGFATAAAGFMVALLSPVLGAIADAAGRRKPWIAAFGVLVRRRLRRCCGFGKPGDAVGDSACADGLCDRRRRRRVRRRVHQCHDADPGAAGAARPALRHRLGGRLCRRAGQPRPRARLPRRQSADRQDAARHARRCSGSIPRCAKATARSGR